jgi:ATP-dependent Clp protease ATP-binding subunit ClpX
MFDLPSREDVASVVITEDVVLNGAEPTMIPHVTKRRKSA